ncbi:MAG: hypothetical protein ACKVZJ_10010 [Phycisphaerales bacterium]
MRLDVTARTPRLMLAAAALAAAAGVAHAGPGIRIVTWNITDYGGGRGPDIQGAVYGVVPAGLALAGKSMDPDIIVTQEMESEAAALQIRNFLNTAPGSPGDWEMEIYTISPDTSKAFYYRTSKVENLGSQIAVFGGSPSGAPRHVMRYDWRPVGYTGNAATVASFGVHMKAGSTATDANRRQAEALAIRNYITSSLLPTNPGINFMILGDFNIGSGNEAAYQTMTALAAGAARVFDPINTPGSWGDVSVFRFVHTQDPATSAGMDDRFDQILCSPNLLDGQGLAYIGNPALAYSTSTWNDPNHSYRAWGNDGTSYNNFLRTTGNTMTGAAIAQDIIDAATTAGGHIPVFMDIKVPAKAGVSGFSINFGTVYQGTTPQIPLTVTNNGDVALFTAAGIDNLDHTLFVSADFTAPGGSFAAVAGTTGIVHQIGMNTAALGPKSGTLTITTDDPANPTIVVALAGTVVPPPSCPGDLNNDFVVNVADLTLFLGNFGLNVPPGTGGDLDNNGVVNVADLTAFLANFGNVC